MSDNLEAIQLAIKETDTQKQCVDCKTFGELNRNITYRGNEYICWNCNKIWLEKREQSAFELWQKFFSDCNDPFVDDDRGGAYCFFCIEDHPNHNDCIWVKAEKLVKNNVIN